MKQRVPFVKDIIILDNDILVQVKEFKDSGIILTDAVKKNFIQNEFKVLKVGSLVNIGEGITEISEGQILVLRNGMLGDADGVNLADFKYEKNALLIQRHMIAYIMLPETK